MKCKCGARMIKAFGKEIWVCDMCGHEIDLSEKQTGCPVTAPKLLKAKSTVETCASCGAWVERYPSFLGESDNSWQCEKCGCTSVKIRDGRPYGPKSSQWAEAVKMFEDTYLDIPRWDWDTVVTEPPMSSLDWQAIEDWFNSRNIYRIFIGPFVVTQQG